MVWLTASAAFEPSIASVVTAFDRAMVDGGLLGPTVAADFAEARDGVGVDVGDCVDLGVGVDGGGGMSAAERSALGAGEEGAAAVAASDPERASD